MARLAGKRVVVTGAASGIGQACARLFAAEGARVTLCDINTDAGECAAEEIRRKGFDATFKQTDVGDESSMREAIDHVINNHGGLDILYNNAGGATAADGRVTDMDLDEFWRTIGVDLFGTFLGCRLAIPYLEAAGGGSIINISSVAGLIGSAVAAAYGASKGAVRLFTKATAIQHAKENIRCNSVHPAPVNPPFIQELLDNPDKLQERVSRVPLGKIGTPDDIAYGVLYLASDEASFVPGSELVIDGGTTAQ